MGYILYYYSYSLEPKEPNQHVGTMRPHQYTSACIWLWCTFVVFWLARYIFWYLCMQLQCVAVRILAHNSSSSSSCCLYIVKKGVWTSDKLSQLMLLECGRLEQHKLLEYYVPTYYIAWRSQNKISHAQHCKKARDGSTLRRLFCAYCMHKVCVCVL